MTTEDERSRQRAFFDTGREQMYGHELGRAAHEHPYHDRLARFIRDYDVAGLQCLEIGSARGVFQDMVEDYTGTDIAESVAGDYHKPYVIADLDGTYPLPDASFDAIWTIAVYEHITELQTALDEIPRLLRPGGLVYFAPAWQCRPWAAEGYEVRPWSDFGLAGKLIKASIPVRNHVLWRSLFVFPKRLFRHLRYLAGHRYRRLPYRELDANWETYWTTDADAVNHIDPHDAILWFVSNGFTCQSHPMHLRAFFVRTGALVFHKR